MNFHSNLLICLVALPLLGCPSENEEDKSLVRKDWPQGWQPHDEHLLDEGFSISENLGSTICGDECYWSGLMNCPDEVIEFSNAPPLKGGEHCTDWKSSIAPGSQGTLIALDSESVLYLHSANTNIDSGESGLYRMFIDGRPGKQVGMNKTTPSTWLTGTADTAPVSDLQYIDIKKADNGEIFALIKLPSAFVLVELEGDQFLPRLVASLVELSFGSSATLENLIVSSQTNTALIVDESPNGKSTSYRVDLLTGEFIVDTENVLGLSSSSTLSLDGRGYTVFQNIEDDDFKIAVDTILIEVDIETGTRTAVPMPDIRADDWFTVDGRRTHSGLYRLSDGYFLSFTKDTAKTKSIFFDSTGTYVGLHAEYDDYPILFYSSPVLVGKTMFAMGFWTNSLYKRSGIWSHADTNTP